MLDKILFYYSSSKKIGCKAEIKASVKNDVLKVTKVNLTHNHSKDSTTLCVNQESSACLLPTESEKSTPAIDPENNCIVSKNV